MSTPPRWMATEPELRGSLDTPLLGVEKFGTCRCVVSGHATPPCPDFGPTAGVASGLYDYIQRSIWSSNDAFANFMYYSPLASALAGVANAKELRLSTDLLMVNPNQGFKWHQDNQNGPIDAFAENTALRWWVTIYVCSNSKLERICF